MGDPGPRAAMAGQDLGTLEAGRSPVVVSVVMAVRNASEHLPAQLRALAVQECPVGWELVVADNGSVDASLDIVRDHQHLLPRVVVVDAAAASGAGATRNAGVRAASGSLLVFCDADDEVAPGWLAGMVRGLAESDLVAARVDFDRLNEPWTMTYRDAGGGLRDTRPAFLPYVFAAAMGVRRDVHEALGGFDETLTGAGEDRDYCYRAQMALGVRPAVVEEAVVHYRTRTSPLAVYRQSRSYALANVQLYRAYRACGLGRPPALRSLAGWLLVPVKGVWSLRSKRSFVLWMQTLGWRVGRLRGSLTYRIWAP
jgi:glycosyltransferase involved in cell wall biosynthesis